ncbi:hypothetical protein pb186bvf_017760 [Paramecium bursaria]
MENLKRNQAIQEAKQQLMKLADEILKKRLNILINSVSIELLKMFKIDDIIEGFKNNLNQLNLQSYDIVMFQTSLIINGTKCFEAFSFDQFGNRRFRSTKESMQNTITKNISSICKALFHLVIIKPFTKQHVIDQAVKNIRKNYLLTKLIAGKQFTRQKLDEFLSIQEYKVFEQPSHKYFQVIQGLSSFDGKIVYIHQDFDYSDYVDQKYVEPDFEIERISQKLFDQPYLALIWLIEYQLMENLSRWTSNSHILSISPERNQNLRIENNQMLINTEINYIIRSS